MMSSTAWTRLVMSSATLHSASSLVLCCQVAWHCSCARQVVYSVGIIL
jgi:hypothetical protein